MFCREMKALAVSLPLMCAATMGVCGEWGPLSANAAGFAHDDGGSLIIACNAERKLIFVGLKEPRAKWQTGETHQVTTRADDGTEMKPSPAHVIAPNQLMMGEDSTWHLAVMGKAKAFFATGVGGYARI